MPFTRLPRKRMINFRLSEPEYEQLKSACERNGARCISDFARAAVLDLAHSEPGAGGAIENRVAELDHTLSSLASTLKQLVGLLDASMADGWPQAADRAGLYVVPRVNQIESAGEVTKVSS